MDDKNPLVLPISKRSNVFENKSGRPRKKDVIRFGSQPKSIIIREVLETCSKDAFLVKFHNTNNKILNSIGKHSLQLDTNKEAPNQEHKKAFIESMTTLTPEAQECINKSRVSRLYFQRKKQDHLFSCDYHDCLYQCKLSCNLIKHKRTHTSEKPYLCDQCTFRSNFSNSLKVHKRLHTKEKPFKCKHCAYQCNSSSNLKKHCQHRHPTAASQ